jgi:hypothetical protein
MQLQDIVLIMKADQCTATVGNDNIKQDNAWEGVKRKLFGRLTKSQQYTLLLHIDQIRRMTEVAKPVMSSITRDVTI